MNFPFFDSRSSGKWDFLVLVAALLPFYFAYKGYGEWTYWVAFGAALAWGGLHIIHHAYMITWLGKLVFLLGIAAFPAAGAIYLMPVKPGVGGGIYIWLAVSVPVLAVGGWFFRSQDHEAREASEAGGSGEEDDRPRVLAHPMASGLEDGSADIPALPPRKDGS